MLFRVLFFLPLAGIASAQTTFCTTSAVPPVVRAEGLAERIGDIKLLCTGAPNATLIGNFTFIVSANISNRLSGGSNTITGVVFTVDSGSGPQPVLVQPLVVNLQSMVFNGVPIAFSAQGTSKITLAGIRVDATKVPIDTPITAFVGINAAGLPLTTSPLVVGTPERGLYTGFSNLLVCAQDGSPLPDPLGGITFTSLLQSQTAFASTRVTEGFADAFGSKSDPNYFNADSGQRIIVQYGGFPKDARLFVPDVIAGSDAVTPTAGGDLELPASGGAYAPTANRSLLLARVEGASPSGASGMPVYTPGAIGSGTVQFDSVSEISIVNGTAFAVYEVVDANPSARETAQFPTFLGLAPDGNREATQTTESVFFAPTSTVGTYSAAEPLPRFVTIPPLADCNFLGDCAFVQGTLVVDTTPITFTEPSNGVTGQSYFTLKNIGGGRMHWTTSITYLSGSGWLSLDPAQGVNNTSVRVYANPANLAPGTYQASIAVNALPAGKASVLVNFIVTAATPTPTVLPTVTGVLNSASLAAVPVVPGSLTTLMGSAFNGKNISVTFNNLPATILFSNDSQINLLVPAELGAATSAQLVVSVDGIASSTTTVSVAPFEPAIFPNALLNQDGKLNSASNAAARGSIVYFFGTGLSGTGLAGTGPITVRIGDRELGSLAYAGPAPGLPGVQQVNLQIPLDLNSGTSNLYVCGGFGDGKVCSLPMPLTIQ